MRILSYQANDWNPWIWSLYRSRRGTLGKVGRGKGKDVKVKTFSFLFVFGRCSKVKVIAIALEGRNLDGFGKAICESKISQAQAKNSSVR